MTWTRLDEERVVAGASYNDIKIYNKYNNDIMIYDLDEALVGLDEERVRWAIIYNNIKIKI